MIRLDRNAILNGEQNSGHSLLSRHSCTVDTCSFSVFFNRYFVR